MENERLLLQATEVKKCFPVETIWWNRLRGIRPQVKAVDGVSLEVRKGETLAVVGESGSGKSTLGRILLRLIEPTDGQVLFKDSNIFEMSVSQLRQFRQQAQIIFQDPYASLNPRMRVGDIIREPLDIYKQGAPAERKQRVIELLERVGLSPTHVNAYPADLSGGQRQRVGIAAALVLSPELIIADEPVSSLDVSVQAQILNLLAELQQDYGLAFIFISHDLGVVQHFSDRVAVMYLGKIVEEAPTHELFECPKHPYTQMLLSVIPIPDPRKRMELQVSKGEPPSPINPPPGCSFHPRCAHAMNVCLLEEPELMTASTNHQAACYLVNSEELTTEERQSLSFLKGDGNVALDSHTGQPR